MGLPERQEPLHDGTHLVASIDPRGPALGRLVIALLRGLPGSAPGALDEDAAVVEVEISRLKQERLTAAGVLSKP